jgi:hypothetical protein
MHSITRRDEIWGGGGGEVRRQWGGGRAAPFMPTYI